MTTDNILKSFREKGIIRSEDIPKINLYMDQVTTFLDEALAVYKRNEGDKILTKTMINNYAKAKILPSPVNKKYSPRHIALLIMIYHLKAILSISDIGILFRSVLDEKDDAEQERLIFEIYSGFLSLQETINKSIAFTDGEIHYKNLSARAIADEYPSAAAEKYLMILMPAYMAYMQKQLAERVLDECFRKNKTEN